LKKEAITIHCGVNMFDNDWWCIAIAFAGFFLSLAAVAIAPSEMVLELIGLINTITIILVFWITED